MAVDLNTNRTAAQRGWGSGWPLCSGRTDVVPVTWSNGVGPAGGVRHGIARLVALLGNKTIEKGYKPHDGWCWGFDCRPIAGTKVASNHSWGLAVDINAPTNPRTYGLHTDMPSWMPDLWNRYGFRWGGDYTAATKDPMHYEFMGTPADAVAMTVKAEQDFATAPTPIPPPVTALGDQMDAFILFGSTEYYFLTCGKAAPVSKATVDAFQARLATDLPVLGYASTDRDAFIARFVNS